MKLPNIYTAIDLFSGCGGLSEGLTQAGFKVLAGIEIDKDAAKTYRMNHLETKLFENDIRRISIKKVKSILKKKPLHLLAGCPPCQGFSTIRKLNRKRAVRDGRNNLIKEYLRFVKNLKPLTIMMENVPGLADYTLFKEMMKNLKNLGYKIKYKTVDSAGYGVPQRRKRLVLIGSILGEIEISKSSGTIFTVRDAFKQLRNINIRQDELHRIYPKHTERIKRLISLVPKNGGSREDLPDEYKLKCHKKANIGFKDIYGRLNWDSVSSTITGGCLKPSKGRFLHPEKNRCITAREAALLQTFPVTYKFPTDISRDSLALLIGNAFPPEFSRRQAISIRKHIEEFYARRV